jgi:predicted chitinase
MNGAGGAGGANQTGGAGNTQNTQGAGNTAPVDVSNYQYQAGDVTPEKLVQMSPGLSLEKAREVAPHLNNAMREAGINTPARQAAFIAQLGHESGNFRYSEEIASGAAYEGRRDLGNTQPGDGERFKGRGYIQLTGRANYAAAGRALGLDLVNNPQLAARPENAARIAAWFWNSRGLNAKADAGDFAGITRSINGGTNGAADRNQRYQAALAALGRDRGNTQMA